MKYFVLEYETVEDYANRRTPYREEHLRLVTAAHARGEIERAGAKGDPIDSVLMVFRGESPAAAEAFANADPYVRHGLITAWRVRPWHVVVGGDS